jgi:hypothetical protein
MAFIREKLTPEQGENLHQIYSLVKPTNDDYPPEPVKPQYWTADKVRDAFLIELGAQGGREDSVYRYFVLIWKELKIEVRYEGQSDWHVVHAIIAPAILLTDRKKIGELENLVKEAILACCSFSKKSVYRQLADPVATPPYRFMYHRFTPEKGREMYTQHGLPDPYEKPGEPYPKNPIFTGYIDHDHNAFMLSVRKIEGEANTWGRLSQSAIFWRDNRIDVYHYPGYTDRSGVAHVTALAITAPEELLVEGVRGELMELVKWALVGGSAESIPPQRVVLRLEHKPESVYHDWPRIPEPADWAQRVQPGFLPQTLPLFARDYLTRVAKYGFWGQVAHNYTLWGDELKKRLIVKE